VNRVCPGTSNDIDRTPPKLRPTLLKAIVHHLKFCTISGDSSVRLEPVYSSLLSRPSMERLLLRDLRPPERKATASKWRRTARARGYR